MVKEKTTTGANKHQKKKWGLTKTLLLITGTIIVALFTISYFFEDEYQLAIEQQREECKAGIKTYVLCKENTFIPFTKSKQRVADLCEECCQYTEENCYTTDCPCGITAHEYKRWKENETL